MAHTAEIQVPDGAPASPVRPSMLAFLVARYCPGPLTVKSSGLASALPTLVQMAPGASQSSVTGSSAVTSPWSPA